ncbi:unnamed protein product, partial [Mesorhabditis belari]|uniref:Protein kinase domain-containing protein n=1 Tax=Mesorhabditis belari TaxID=2138241 RepID=A0AAF3EGH5_9BILA
MSLFGKFKNLFKGSQQDSFKTPLPAIIQNNVDPRDTWQIIGELGDGAFGKVEKVVNKSEPNLFAAEKCIEVQDGEELEDFLVEIEILTACKHENIVSLFACYFFDQKLHMMLELCSGGAVDDIMIELEKPLTESQIAYIARNCCEALRFLHQNNVIHRDLKAGNILLTHTATVKLADFGVSAKLKDRNERRDTFIGTPYWMAPEVMMCETFKDQPYDVRSDIWSFGITLIEMAQMEPPNSNVSPMRVLIKVQKSEPPTLENPNAWSLYFNDFLKQCLMKDPNNRPLAEELKSHPFLKSGTDRRSVLALLAEMKAEVKQVEVMDDNQSVDESVADSEDTDERTSAVWNESDVSLISRKHRPAPPPPQPQAPKILIPQPQPVQQKPRAPSPPPDRQPMQPQLSKNGLSSGEEHTARVEKFPAPPPPKSSSRERSTNGQHVDEPRLLSPGQEAMNVLEDLNVLLDKDTNGKSDSGSIGQASPRKMPPPTVHERKSHGSHVVHSPEPTRLIKTVVDNARHSVPSPVLLTQPQVRAAYSEESMHKRSSESVNADSKSITKSESAQSVNKNFANIIRVRMDVNDNESEKRASAVNDLRNRFETTSNESGTSSPSISIPEGHVQNKIKQVIHEQQSQESGQSAEKIKSKRREADAILFQPAVSKIAESFEHIKPEGDVVFTPKVPVPVQNGVHRKESSQSSNGSAKQASSTQRSNANFEQKPSTTNVPHYEDDDYFAEDKRELAGSMPPPEPPVDYHRERSERKARSASKENQQPSPISVSSSTIEATEVKRRLSPTIEQQPEPTALAPISTNGHIRRRNPNRQTVTKKTRTYMVDGVEVTSTTLHVMGKQQNLQLKRQEMQELKRLQREEGRQLQELEAQGSHLNEQQEKKQQQEKSALQRQFELDLEALNRKQKKEIEEAERMQDEELRSASKRLKYEQEKDITAFRERLRQELKIVKQEVEMLPKTQRKEALKMRKDQAEAQNRMKEQEFGQQLMINANTTLARMQQKHKEKIASLERQFILQRHMLLRGKESAEWELEERVMSERYVLHRKLFKDRFFLLRTQMLSRQQKEMSQMQRIHQMEEDELIRALQLDRKRLPKMLRSEAKTRSMMFKESLRISLQAESQAELQDRMRRFEETEKSRINNALKEHDQKSQRKVQLLKERHLAEIQELDEAQNDNRKLLLEREHATMAEHERKYAATREQWHRELAPKKMDLEQKFQEELESQEQFYGISLGGGGSLNGTISSTSMLPAHMYP